MYEDKKDGINYRKVNIVAYKFQKVNVKIEFLKLLLQMHSVSIAVIKHRGIKKMKLELQKYLKKPF